jgi:hypothetical protein
MNVSVTGPVLTFTGGARLAAGDLLEIVDALGISYAEVEGDSAAGETRARWLAGFTPASAPGGLPAAVSVSVLGETALYPATWDPATGSLSFAATPPPLAAGRWLVAHDAGGDRLFLVRGMEGASPRVTVWTADPMPRAPANDAHAVRVTLSLRTELGRDAAALGAIGLCAGHAGRFWTFAADDDAQGSLPSPLPIARHPADRAAAPAAWLPLGLEGSFSAPAKVEHDGRTPLERDGLSRFDAELFLDPDLAEVRAPAIAAEAERILHVAGRPLFGIHAGFAAGDGANYNPVSLIAVPDAVQPGWERLAAPPLPPPDASGAAPAHWFDHRGPCARPPDGGSEALAPDRSRFLDCTTRALQTPLFEPVASPPRPGTVRLGWSAADGAGAVYVLEQAALPGFEGAVEIYRGLATSHAVPASAEGFYYFRLRVEQAGEVSAPAVCGFSVSAFAWQSLAPAGYDPAPLLRVQRALIRMAAGTGEMFALLSLPRHFEAAPAAAHAASLSRYRSGLSGDPFIFDFNERRALSYAALHHPWVVSRGGGGLITAPPDGVVAGSHARRTLARGAWIAAANEPFADIVALAPVLGESDWASLDLARVNLIRRDPRGFLLLGGNTLSDETEWRQVNVRRLMCLLRRAAIRRGAAYVFEPNGEVLRRAVERGFGQMLEHMFHLGAFAGQRPQDSYRLAVDPTSQDRDAGRLIVEIGVAPAQPMRFLTVRLAQAGERFTIAEEA